jgi:hypothetical protein
VPGSGGCLTFPFSGLHGGFQALVPVGLVTGHRPQTPLALAIASFGEVKVDDAGLPRIG